MELLKLTGVLGWHHIKGRRKQPTDHEQATYLLAASDEPIPNGASPSRTRGWGFLPSRRTGLQWFMIAGFYASSAYLASLLSTDAEGSYNAHVQLFAGTTLCALGLGRWVLEHPSGVVDWQSVMLQLCGVLIMSSTLSQTPLHVSLSVSATGLALLMAAANALTEHAFSASASSFVETIIPLVASGAVIHCGVALLRAITTSQSQFTPHVLLSSRPSAPSPLVIFEAAASLSSLAIIYYHEAITLTVLLTIGSGLAYIPQAASLAVLTSAGSIVGIGLIVFGATTFVSYTQDSHDEPPDLEKDSRRKYVTLAVVGVVSTLFSVLTATSQQPCGMIAGHYPPHCVVAHASANVAAVSTCIRKPLPFKPSTNGSRTFHTFDNVLLIVFFSHARYGANLEYYKEVYTEFFPNILFIGPASLEDGGFSHSYDIMVDSYQSDEDLSDPSFYKMSGRMAHHMLYTAMMEHSCYDGYLWVPFDTLLNIPRLQAFDQSRFWYHSPWGKFVHNPEVSDTADSPSEIAASSSINGGNSARGKHAPPANISPDPRRNLTEGWKGWQQDWWWG
ncbi:hypothetical protein HGRIS_006023 [Hohenbuehelia grisea]|uniref:Uncharacterized protein n=1 Tax=Hohenbuehelia grisea TaxID=104357 RepID=A0ABR3K128_9AGAR